MKVRAIVTTLADQGIKVLPSMVYVVKRRAKRKQKLQRVAQATKHVKTADPAELVLMVKELAARAGGLEKLKQLVEALAR